MNKYRNRKIVIDNIKFDSVLEANRYRELKLLQRAKEISNLRLQVPFVLQEGFKKNGKTYQAIKYIADFVYEEKGQIIVEDTKSKATMTELYKVKKKLFEKKYQNLTIKEIM